METIKALIEKLDVTDSVEFSDPSQRDAVLPTCREKQCVLPAVPI